MAQGAVGGIGVFFGRWLTAHGVHLHAIAAVATARAIPFYRQRGFQAALWSLRQGPPRLLLRPAVAPVSLAEVWLHHDDLRRANNLDPPDEPETLDAAVEFALRYQRRPLRTATVDRSASSGDLLRWLAGRPSSLPGHQPPLPF